MKNIIILGKRNIDKISFIGQTIQNNDQNDKNDKNDKNIQDDIQPERSQMNGIEDKFFLYKYQLEMMNKLFLGLDFEFKCLVEKELERKIQGYKQQDIKKYIYKVTEIVNLEDVIEMLIVSKLKCCYCAQEIQILYKNVREPYQWTLDRKDNTKGHTKPNTLISCLKCNLQRRMTDVDKFIFTKKLKIKKSSS
jgi:hypothetical protein